MNGEERRKQILRLAISAGSLSTGDLAQRYRVSRMTIHRDLKALEKIGALKCIHGGALPVRRVPVVAGKNCQSCFEPVLSHQRYLLEKPDQRQELFCCASCGLKTQLQYAGDGAFYASDLISGMLLPARDAYFLIRSSASPCCQPSILTFAGELEAAAFRSGFGGVLARLNETLDFLRIEQSLHQSR